MRLFGTDGIRGKVNEDLTPDLAFRLGNAVGRLFGGEVLIAKDTRITGDMLESALASGLTSAGADALICGVLPTPALALLSHERRAVGIVISASHNPPQFNGIKVLKNGFKIAGEEEERVEELMENIVLESFQRVGRVRRFDNARDVYIDRVLNMFSDLKLEGYELALDVANGASVETSPIVFEKLGARVNVFANEPNGLNINQGCGSTNPDFLRSVKQEGVIGIAHDGDADRCVMLDEEGGEVHGDKILGISALNMKREGRLKNNRVVATVMSNLGLEEYLKKNGIELERTKVGDRYVLERMLETGTYLGGERSGHVIFLDRSTTGDGLITALEILRVVVKSKKSLIELHSEIVDYPQIIINVEVHDKSISSDRRVISLIDDLSEPGYRIVVRPSGTEPVIRVMVEGKDREKVEAKAGEIAGLIGEINRGFEEDYE